MLKGIFALTVLLASAGGQAFAAGNVYKLEAGFSDHHSMCKFNSESLETGAIEFYDAAVSYSTPIAMTNPYYTASLATFSDVARAINAASQLTVEQILSSDLDYCETEVDGVPQAIQGDPYYGGDVFYPPGTGTFEKSFSIWNTGGVCSHHPVMLKLLEFLRLNCDQFLYSGKTGLSQ